MKGHVVELCSGFGKVTEWFRENGYQAHRFEVDPYFNDIPDTTIKNVMDIQPEELPMNPKFFWASPPCNTYSPVGVWRYWIRDKGNMRPKTFDECRFIKGREISTDKAMRYYTDLIDSLALIRHISMLIDKTKPKYYLVENPVGALKYVLFNWERIMFDQAIFGTAGKKPTYLFGNHPPQLVAYLEHRMALKDYDWEVTEAWGRKKRGTLGLAGSRLRSMIPYELGRIIGLAIEGRLELGEKIG